MCICYRTFFACGCEAPSLIIERCTIYLHSPDLADTCNDMILKDHTRIAVVCSDSWGSTFEVPSTYEPDGYALVVHDESMPNFEGDRRARVPCREVCGRYVTREELESLPMIEVISEEDGEVKRARVLGLDALQSLKGNFEAALPPVEDVGRKREGNGDVGAFKSLKSLQAALPAMSMMPIMDSAAPRADGALLAAAPTAHGAEGAWVDVVE